MSLSDRDQLVGILQLKKEWLTKMRELTEQCGVLIKNDDVVAFSQTLEEREGIIGKIDAFSKTEKQIPDTHDAQIVVLKQEIRGIIQEIIRLDEQNEALAREKIELYKADLKNLNQKKEGIGKYKNAYQKNDAFYFDEKK